MTSRVPPQVLQHRPLCSQASRRQMLSGLAAAGAGLVAAPRPLRAATRILRLATVVAPGSAQGLGLQAFVEAAASLSEGRLRIEPFFDGALGGPGALAKALSQGTLDLVSSGPDALARLSTEIALLDAPYLLPSPEQARSALDGALGEHFADLIRPYGIRILGWGESGIRHISANRPIRRAADLKGLKLRVAPTQILVEAFRAMGAAAESVPLNQLYEALRNGRFEAQENPISNVLANKYYQLQTYLSLTGHVYSAAFVGLANDVWDELPPADRALLTRAARAGCAVSRSESQRAEVTGIAKLEEFDIRIIRDIDRESFLAASERALTRLSELYGVSVVERLISLTRG